MVICKKNELFFRWLSKHMMKVERHNKFNAYDPWHNTPHSQHKQWNLKSSNITFITIQNKSARDHLCFVLLSSFVCISAYAHVYFKTIIIQQNIKITLIAGVPSSQALPGLLITAPPSVCVPDSIGLLAVWIQRQIKKKALRRGMPLVLRFGTVSQVLSG